MIANIMLSDVYDAKIRRGKRLRGKEIRDMIAKIRTDAPKF